MTVKKVLMGVAASAAILTGANTAIAADEITVAYFLEWPMPFQYAKANGLYDEALGTKVNWVSFDAGTAMSAAMASGDVQISLSQGLPPFVVATSAGQDLQIVDIAVSYSDNDNCVVAEVLEIDKTNTAELAGKKVAVPIGTAAHFGFLEQMNHFGVDVSSMQIVDMAPAEGAVALSQGDIDMACGWGGGLRRMKESGNILLTGAEKEELGILVFDVTSATADFVSKEADVLAKFLKVTAEMNAMWNAGDNKDEMLAVIAKDAGMELADAADSLATFAFPSIEEQSGEKWLGGGVQSFMTGVAQVFKDAGSVPSTLDSYDSAVNAEVLNAAGEM